jgi:predicted phosphodiesterase
MGNSPKSRENWNKTRRERRATKKDALKKAFDNRDRLLENSNSVKNNVLEALSEKYSAHELKRLLVSSNIYTPDAVRYQFDFTGEIIKFGIMGDTHIGSKHSDPASLNSALEEMDRQQCQFIAHTGDLVEGMMARPNHVLELRPDCIGYKAMLQVSIAAFERWSKPLYVIAGNHDASFDLKYGIGMNLVEDFCERTGATYCGTNDGDFYAGKTRIKLWHGGDGATARALTYRDQLVIESLSGGDKPNLLITGHIHKMHYFFLRNVHCICAGTLQKQTTFMRAKKLSAHVGFWIVTMCVDKETGEIKWIEPRMYPLY